MANNRLLRKLLFFFWRLKRPMTLGVRIFLQNEHGRVLLVRHTYIKGWYLPGGGVEKGETAIAAARKELMEEANIQAKNVMVLFGSYLNRKAANSDHVLLFVCKTWEQVSPFKPNREIAEIGFFDPENLPEGTTQSTRDRLAEIINSIPVSEEW